MNKKILFFNLLVASLSPVVVMGASTTLGGFALNIEATAIAIATPIVIIGWIIAGILYLTSAGSPEKTGTAKKAMIACVIGTILVVLAMGSGAIVTIIQNALGL